MRHRNTLKKLGRTSSHRKATLRNLAIAIVEHKKIRTTYQKAKAAQRFVDRLVSYAKQDTVHARRLAFKHLQSRELVQTLFDEIGPAFADRNGGYTRVVKLGRRRGDGAELAMLQLVGFEEIVVDSGDSKKKGKKKAAAKSAPAKGKAAKPKAGKAAPAAEASAAEAVEEVAAEADAPKAGDAADADADAPKAEESPEATPAAEAEEEAPKAEEEAPKAEAADAAPEADDAADEKGAEDEDKKDKS